MTYKEFKSNHPESTFICKWAANAHSFGRKGEDVYGDKDNCVVVSYERTPLFNSPDGFTVYLWNETVCDPLDEPETVETPAPETAEETETAEEITVKTVNPVLDALEVLDRVQTALDSRKDRSAWDKGVTVYAAELLEGLRESIEGGYFDPEDLAAPKLLNRELLNGADDWNQYSWGGSSLIYDGDIARRLCSPSELRKTREGERRPNAREEWLDTQARALFQAAHRLTRIIRDTL